MILAAFEQAAFDRGYKKGFINGFLCGHIRGYKNYDKSITTNLERMIGVRAGDIIEALPEWSLEEALETAIFEFVEPDGLKYATIMRAVNLIEEISDLSIEKALTIAREEIERISA